MGKQDEKFEEFLPFNAINEFMRDDYRATVLLEVMNHLELYPPDLRKELSHQISRHVKIQGFRNSNQAPAALKARNAAALFQKSADFSAAVIHAWSSIHPDLQTTVEALLTEKGWDPLPLEADRARLPGFQIHWPKADTFEVLNTRARELNPGLGESDDDISLMVVWVGNRLPYDLFIDDKQEQDA